MIDCNAGVPSLPLSLDLYRRRLVDKYCLLANQPALLPICQSGYLLSQLLPPCCIPPVHVLLPLKIPHINTNDHDQFAGIEIPATMSKAIRKMVLLHCMV